MTSPTVLRAALVSALRSIGAIVAMVGNDEENIVEFTERGDLTSALSKLKPPRIMVVYQGTAPAGRKEALWSHAFSIVLRPTGDDDAIEMFTAIVNGILNSQILPEYHPMELPTLSRRSVAVSDSTFLDIWEMSTRFVGTGVQ